MFFWCRFFHLGRGIVSLPLSHACSQSTTYMHRKVFGDLVLCVYFMTITYSLFFPTFLPSSSYSQLDLSISIMCFLATLTFVPYFRCRNVLAHPWKPISSLSTPQQCKTPTQSSSSVLIRPGINRKRASKRLPFIRQHERMDFPKNQNLRLQYYLYHGCIWNTKLIHKNHPWIHMCDNETQYAACNVIWNHIMS